MTTSIAQRAYSRIDLRKNNAVGKDELKDWLKSLGVDGFLGSRIRSEAANAFLDAFDTTGERTVSYPEFQTGLPKLVAEVLGGKISLEQVDSLFDRYDSDKRNGVSMQELKTEVAALFRKQGLDHPDIRADVAARSAIDLLSTDRRAITREDFRQAVAEVFPAWAKAAASKTA